MTCHRFDENRFSLVTVLPVAGKKTTKKRETERNIPNSYHISHDDTAITMLLQRKREKPRDTPTRLSVILVALSTITTFLSENRSRTRGFNVTFVLLLLFFFFFFFSSIYEKVFDNLLELRRRPRKRTSAAVLVSIFAPKMITITKSGVLMFSGPAAAIIKEQNNKRANFSFYFCCC